MKKLIQKFNNVRNVLNIDVNSSDLSSILSLLPDGYAVRELVEPATGTKVNRPETGYTKAKITGRKKVARTYTAPSLVNLFYLKPETTDAELQSLNGVLNDRNGNNADIVSLVFYKEM